MRWWDLWRDYTLYDKPAVPAQPALSRSWSGTAKGERPAEIDNSDLLPRPDCTRLQSGLVENQDFILLHEEAWKKLHGWYGGGPALRRRVIGSSENQLRVELYPLCLTVFQVDDYGNPERDRPMQIMPSTHETVDQVIRDLLTNLDLRDPDGVHAVRLWHRPNFELDQTSLDSLEGWEQLEMESTLEDVADGASILLERSRGETWPFFQRLRLEYKRQNFKDPRDANVVLEVGDKIDASTTTEEQKWDSYQRDYVWKDVLHWYAATVADAEETRLLVQFHNRPKPKGKSLSIASLLVEGEKAEPIEVGRNYESLDSRGNWHQVNITAENDDKTFEAQLLDEPSTWPVVQPENVRQLSMLTPEAEQAFEKVFARYGSNGVIERGGLRGLLSCATNEYIPEDAPRVAELLKPPFGSEEGVPLAGLKEYWRQYIVRMQDNQSYFVKNELSRLFERVGVEMRSPEEQLLAQGREWIERDSDRLAQYRSQTEPQFQDTRSFRDFRRRDKLDVRFGMEWQTAEVLEVNWEEMTVLVQTTQPNSVNSPSSKSQREWIPMESERLAEFETKSQEAEHEAEPSPLLARSVSTGGVCARPGACGLQNLGNTCFMNSTLQCLSNSTELRSFFAGTSGDPPAFVNQISTSPLSTEGRIAREFSQLLRLMWSNEKRSVAPAALKKLIGQKRPEFSGYQQHDAQELLCFLLDALHEDVNRAPYPFPPAADDENDGQKSEEARAREMWEQHRRRSDSEIVDLFQFQIRSELECPVCRNVSVTFDPIMYLTLPVPKPPHSVSVRVVPADYPLAPLTAIDLEVAETATMEELEGALWTALDRTPSAIPSCFCFADVCYGRIYKHFEPHNLVSTIRPGDNVHAFEVQLSPDVSLAEHHFVDVVVRKRGKATIAAGSAWQYDKFDTPRLIAVTRNASNSDVYDQLTKMAEHMLSSFNIPPPWSFEISAELDASGMRGGELLPNRDTPFRSGPRPPQTLGIDFVQAKQADMLKEALPKPPLNGKGSKGAAGTTLISCLKKGTEREVLAEADSVYCRKCKEFRRQSKKLDLWSLPPLLIVHLKRFGRERLDGPLVKLRCVVDFEMQLDLKDFMCSSSPTSTRFQLYGVVNHHGNVGGGHYTAHAVVTSPAPDRLDPGEWYNFNDSLVDKASETDLDKEAAYVLFYRRVDS
ncbi:UBP8 [Symbiodinium necroappetens]|uniref:UBP8 protein n=1 Tax=Symbiodinium necroappetens TaxID=1628268 RepID=A0A812ZH32_9DINO|nr:UBP8 [Symbiodinium necroappetens]